MTGVMIDDGDKLYRRLHSEHIDRKTGKVRANAYKISVGGKNQPEQEPSVEIARMSDPHECAERDGRIGWGCGILKAKKVRAIGLDIKHDGIPVKGHAVLIGEITMDTCNQLAEITRVKFLPDMVNGSKRIKQQP